MNGPKVNTKKGVSNSEADEWDFKLDDAQRPVTKSREEKSPLKKSPSRPQRLSLNEQSGVVRKSRSAIARESGPTKKVAPNEKIPANLVLRGIAFLIDIALFALGAVGAIFSGESLTSISSGIYLSLGLEVPLMIDTYTIAASALLVYFFFNVVMVVMFRATIGKSLMGLRVRGYNYVDLNFKAAVAREFLFKPFAILLIVDFVMPLFNKERRSLHDMLSGTMVVKRKKR